MKNSLSLAAVLLVGATTVGAQEWVGSAEGGLFVTGRTSADTDIAEPSYTGIWFGGQTSTEVGGF